MTLSIIVAVAENMVIGKDNSLIWHISEDLKRFKAITEFHTVIMGRKTYLSLPYRPLKNRRNIVISKTMAATENVEVVKDIESALAICSGEEEVFVIGGAMLYAETMALSDKIYLTKVLKSFDGDVYFPSIDYDVWHVSEVSDTFTDAKSGLKYRFELLIRK